MAKRKFTECLKQAIHSIVVIVFLSFVFCCGSIAQASDYPVKEIEMILPAAGGGVDLQARIIARYLSKYLPNEVTIVPLNVAGVSSIAASTQLYASRPDGYTIGATTIGDCYTSEFLSPEPIAFQTANFVYIGTWATDTRAIGFTSEVKATTWDELVNESHEKRIVFGTSGRGGGQHNDPMIVGMNTDANFSFVHYEGSGQIVPALGRGEISGHMAAASSVARSVDQGIGRFFCVFADERDPDFPDVPTALEIGMPKDQYEKIINIPFFGTARVVQAPPNTDSDVVKTLREAFWKAIHDPGLINEFKTAGAQYFPITGEETQEIVAKKVQNLASHPELIQELRDEIDK